MLPSLSDAPNIKAPSDGQVLRVSCPYCLVGFTEILIEVNHRNNSKSVERIHDPRKCVTCGKFFRLRPRVVVEGVPLEV